MLLVACWSSYVAWFLGDDPSTKHNGPQSDAAKMLDIDVSAPLRKDEMLQVLDSAWWCVPKHGGFVLQETKEYKMQTREDVEREDRRKARQAKKVVLISCHPERHQPCDCWRAGGEGGKEEGACG